MEYLKFDKNLMINLEHSLKKEMLRTNQAGAYHCTTIVDCNTRKEHGLLVVPLNQFGGKNFVMLSALDVTVIQHGAEFNLALHRYKGGVYSPNGHKYIREYDCETVPKVTYRVGGVVMTKEKIFISHENRLLIRYTIVDAHSETTLRIRPLLAFRETGELCIANDKANSETIPVENGVGACLYPGFPTLYMQLSHKPQWIPGADWWKDFEYVKDMERGVPYCEDLFTPGYFEIKVRKGQSLIFSAGLDPISPRKLKGMYEKELTLRTRRTSFFNCLKNAVKQCYLKEPDGMYLLSGYPWTKILARNTFMALPGATIAIGHKEDFQRIYSTAFSAMQRFMNTGKADDRIHGIDLPDIPLWAAWAAQQYEKAYHTDRWEEKEGSLNLREAVKEMVDFILEGKHPFVQIQAQGMLAVEKGVEKPLSWMNASWEGRPVIPRNGLLVEVNALWYNALMFLGEEKYVKIAERMREPFVATFLNDYGYLYDYVTGPYKEPAVRPNMAVAIGLDHSPLDRRQRKGVLDVVTRELLTPKGLRTLSPKSYGYLPFYQGSPHDRELALHNGPARPWLMGFYAEAYLKIFGRSGVGYIDRMLIGFEDEMPRGCIGSLSQMYDANPPYRGRGAISHVTNVAEVLRTLAMISDPDNLTDQKL